LNSILAFKRPPIFHEDGSIYDVQTGEYRQPGQPAAQPETKIFAAPAPDITDTKAMLHTLFDPAFVHPHPDAWIEIAYGHPDIADGAVRDAQNYGVFELEAVARFAEAKNKAGFNIYIAPALRSGKQPRSGRAKAEHVLTSAFAWAEFDDAGDAERIDAILKANKLTPAMVVTTGTVPHQRAHLYFRIDGTVTPAQLEAANASLMALLSTDEVKSVDRLLRLAGTTNYPNSDKVGRGYIAELTTLRSNKDARSYSADELIGFAPKSSAPSDPYLEYAKSVPGQGRSDAEIEKLFKSINGKDGGKEKWRNPMIKIVGTFVGRGMTDSAIKFACAAHCNGGIEDKDLKKLIDDQRKDFDKPDPGDKPIERKPAAVPVHATPFVFRDPATIPQREWLYGQLLVRKIVSATISPGGIGKSSLVAVEALAMVSAKALLGVSPPEPLRVWLWNLEDPQEETERKIQAAAKHYKLKPDDMSDRLLIDSGRDQKLVIAQTTREGAVIVQPVVDSLVAEIIKHQIDVLIIDPFVSCHEVAENDNSAMDMVVKEWGRVAERGNCAVHLVHHTRKMGDATEVTTESSRGGSSQTDACRVVRTVNRMSKADAEKAGIENPRLYFRTYNDKANFAPPVENSDWFKLESVDLGYGPLGLPGDSVGVVVEWEWPDATAGMTAADYDKVVAEIRGGVWKENSQASNWAGLAIAEALDLDLEKATDRAKVKAALKMYIQAGTLIVVERLDGEQRRPKKFVEVPDRSRVCVTSA
jgi:hypothetical protein